MEEKQKTEIICRSIFKSAEDRDIQKRYTQKWVEIINKMEKNRDTI